MASGRPKGSTSEVGITTSDEEHGPYGPCGHDSKRPNASKTDFWRISTMTCPCGTTLEPRRRDHRFCSEKRWQERQMKLTPL
jgi:hypothetical protein